MIISQFFGFVNTFRINFCSAFFVVPKTVRPLFVFCPSLADRAAGERGCALTAPLRFSVRACLTLFVIAVLSRVVVFICPRLFNAFRYYCLISRSCLYLLRACLMFSVIAALLISPHSFVARFDPRRVCLSLAPSELPRRSDLLRVLIYIAALIFRRAYSFPHH